MSQQTTPHRKYEARPPIASVGVIGWIRQNLFNSPLNSVLTIIIMAGFIQLLPPVIKWAFINSSYNFV